MARHDRSHQRALHLVHLRQQDHRRDLSQQAAYLQNDRTLLPVSHLNLHYHVSKRWEAYRHNDHIHLLVNHLRSRHCHVSILQIVGSNSIVPSHRDLSHHRGSKVMVLGRRLQEDQERMVVV